MPQRSTHARPRQSRECSPCNFSWHHLDAFLFAACLVLWCCDAASSTWCFAWPWGLTWACQSIDHVASGLALQDTSTIMCTQQCSLARPPVRVAVAVGACAVGDCSWPMPITPVGDPARPRGLTSLIPKCRVEAAAVCAALVAACVLRWLNCPSRCARSFLLPLLL